MNQLIWHFGAKDESIAPDIIKEGWIFDSSQADLAKEYAKDAKEHLLRLLIKKDRKGQADTIEWLQKVIQVKTLLKKETSPKTTKTVFTDKANAKLELLFRGHRFELEKESWFKDYLENPIKNEYASDYFDYEKWGEMKKWRTKLMTATGVVICPYCDRQYITNFSFEMKDGEKNKTLSTLDHFYTKSKYPLFALSLFNFIPACYGCNSVIRGDEALNIYPYRPDYNTFSVFKLEISKSNKKENTLEIDKYNNTSNLVDFILCKENAEFSITQTASQKLPPDISAEVNSDINTLKLNNVYTVHQDYVKDLLTIRRFYEESNYRSYVENLLNNTVFENGMKFPVTVNKLRLFLIGDDWINETNSSDLIPKRPLSKLTNAILNDDYIKEIVDD